MRLTRNAALAGLASLALAGAAAAATPEPRFHSMRVDLPNGGTAIIQYTGDTPPRVEVGSMPASEAFAPARARLGFDPAPFAALDRLAALMHARAAAMMQRLALAESAPDFAGPRLDLAAGSGPMPGMAGYSLVSQVTSDGTCTRRVTVTREAPDKKAKVLTETSGDCADAPAAPAADEAEAKKPAETGPATGTFDPRTI